jgi:small subunit ribosomal protein S2
MASGEIEAKHNKLETQRFQEEIDLLNERYGGIKDMNEQPAALLVADMIQDKNAIKEAKALGIPVFALADTNADPTGIDYVIPSNDDAVKAVDLILGYFVEAIKEGKSKNEK